MRDDFSARPAGEDDLVLKALLYVSGELDATEVEAFEKRLGEDQAARDALCRAVELTQPLAPTAWPGPHPAYRLRVCHRLRQRRRQRFGLAPASGYFGHPAFWSILGATLAVLLMIVISQYIAGLEVSPAPAPGAPAAPSVSADVVRAWADWHNNDRLARVCSEVQERHQRERSRPDYHRGRVVDLEDIRPK